MSVFERIQEKIINATKTPDLIKSSEPDDSGVIGDAANAAISEDSVKASSEEAEASVFGSAINDVSTNAEKIELIQANRQHYIYSNAAAAADESAKQAVTLNKNIDVGMVGFSGSRADYRNHILATAIEQMNGVSTGVGKQLSKPMQDALNTYINQKISTLHQSFVTQNAEEAIGDQIVSAIKTAPSVISMANTMIASNDKQTQAKGYDMLREVHQSLLSYVKSAPTAEQRFQLNNLANKAYGYQDWKKADALLSNNGHPLFDKVNYFNLNNTEQLTQAMHSVFSGQTPNNSYFASNENYPKTMSSLLTAKSAYSAMKVSKNIRGTIANLEQSTNPILQKAGKFYDDMLRNGKGMDILDAVAPDQMTDINNNIALAENESSNPATAAQGQARLADATSKIRNLADTYGIPMQSITFADKGAIDSVNNLVDSNTQQDSSGNITSLDFNNASSTDAKNVRNYVSTSPYVPISGDTPVSNGLKFLRGTPQNISGYDINIAVSSFNPKVQQYVARLKGTGVFLDKNSKNAIKNVHDLKSYQSYILRNASDYHLAEYSAYTGVPVDKLAMALATQSVIEAHEGQVNLSAGGDNLKDYDKRIQQKMTTAVAAIPVVSGYSNGVAITVNNDMANTLLPFVHDNQEKIDIFSAAGKAVYNRMIEHNAEPIGMTAKNEKERLQNQTIRENAIKNAHDNARPYSDYKIVSQNGQLVLLSPSGEAHAIPATDIAVAEHSHEQNQKQEAGKKWAYPGGIL